MGPSRPAGPVSFRRRDVRLPEAGRNAPVAFVVIDLINRVLRRRAEDAAKNAIRRLAPA
jgi:hypothetical protein